MLDKDSSDARLPLASFVGTLPLCIKGRRLSRTLQNTTKDQDNIEYILPAQR